MEWFGPRYGAPYESDSPPVDAPIGQHCAWCDEPIKDGDSGLLVPLLADTVTQMPYHYECQMRSILGGVNHQRGTCTCCGGPNPPDDPHLTKREAAQAAYGYACAMKGIIAVREARGE